MSRKVVKQSNALIEASYKLTVVEKRLICLGIANSNGDKEALKKCEIHASQYAEQFNVSQNAAYKALNEAALQLFERKWSYKEEGKRGTVTKLRRWVQGVDYGHDGVIRLVFADDVLPVLIDLKKTFTYYDIKTIANLSSVYAIRLYELIIQWRSVGKTPVFELNEFRRLLGVDSNEYPRMTNFKQRVLEPAIKQLNDYTDITAKYEQHKRGRSISGFSFTFTQKNPKKAIHKGRPTITKAQAQEEARPGEGWKELYKRLSHDFTITDP